MGYREFSKKVFVNLSDVNSFVYLYLPVLINENFRNWMCRIIMLSNLTILFAVMGIIDILLYRYFMGVRQFDLNETSSSSTIVMILPFVLSILAILLLIFNYLVFYVLTTMKTSLGRVELIQQDYILYLQYYITLLTFALPTVMSYLMFSQYNILNKFDEIFQYHINNYYKDKKAKMMVDQIQIKYQCCGKSDPYEDWKLIETDNAIISEICEFERHLDPCVLIPFSCCDSLSNYSCNAIRPLVDDIDKNGFYSRGCVHILNNQFNLSLFHILFLLSIIFALMVVIAVLFQYLRVSVHNAIINNHPKLTSYGWLIGKYIDEIEQKDLLKNDKFKFVIKVKLKPLSTTTATTFTSLTPGANNSSFTRKLWDPRLLGTDTNKVNLNARYIIFNNNAIATVKRDKEYHIDFTEGVEPKVIVSNKNKAKKRVKKRKAKKKR